ncbi:MAG: hypothetical protein NVS9B12_15610 [Vulcanimicrobiaceae bacterium]
MGREGTELFLENQKKWIDRPCADVARRANQRAIGPMPTTCRLLDGPGGRNETAIYLTLTNAPQTAASPAAAKT